MSADHHNATETELEKTKAEAPGRLWFVVIGILVLLAVLAAWGIISRLGDDRRLKAETDDQAIPTVTVIEAKEGPTSEELVLPGNVQANVDTPVYARTSGYIRKWYTDIGAPVKAGQLLADIDTPEVDDQLRQARADLDTAIANDKLAEITSHRWQALLKTDSVTRQETDEKIGDAEAKRAAVASARANVARLEELEGYKHVLAPYDGIVTARDTDVGDLINAGAGGGPELFRVADKTRLRIYVQVPETYASVAVPGQVVDLSFAEHPGQNFTATMVRTSEALDPNARTLLVELQADNASGALLPGGFAEVHLKAPAAFRCVRLPVSALLFRQEGLRVATVEGDGRARLNEVKPGRDFGTEIEILTGISPGQRVIIDPPDSLVSGDVVRVAPPPNERNTDGSSGSGASGGKHS